MSYIKDYEKAYADVKKMGLLTSPYQSLVSYLKADAAPRALVADYEFFNPILASVAALRSFTLMRSECSAGVEDLSKDMRSMQR